jgi:hypothetical protein
MSSGDQFSMSLDTAQGTFKGRNRPSTVLAIEPTLFREAVVGHTGAGMLAAAMRSRARYGDSISGALRGIDPRQVRALCRFVFLITSSLWIALD